MKQISFKINNHKWNIKLKPRYILRKETDKCNYMEYKELLAKYGIQSSSFQYSQQTYKELDEFLNIICEKVYDDTIEDLCRGKNNE